MSNLYEILEVSEKASKEVIDKAYHVLVKKYHPDLQQENTQKQKAEIKIKKINEAYEILSNEEKRKQYDLKLKQKREEQKRIEIQKQQNTYKQNNIQEELKQEREQESNNIKNLQNEMKRAYNQAYEGYLRNIRLQNKRTMDIKTFY